MKSFEFLSLQAYDWLTLSYGHANLGSCNYMRIIQNFVLDEYCSLKQDQKSTRCDIRHLPQILALYPCIAISRLALFLFVGLSN